MLYVHFLRNVIVTQFACIRLVAQMAVEASRNLHFNWNKLMWWGTTVEINLYFLTEKPDILSFFYQLHVRDNSNEIPITCA